MLLIDVNVLVYAHREDATDHARYKGWLYALLNSQQAFGVSELVLSGFLRVVTHPKVFKTPSPLEQALKFTGRLRNHEHAIVVAPGSRHFGIFLELCSKVKATGNLIPDAYLAALAIESGCDWITTDKDYARFSGLRSRHPLGL